MGSASDSMQVGIVSPRSFNQAWEAADELRSIIESNHAEEFTGDESRPYLAALSRIHDEAKYIAETEDIIPQGVSEDQLIDKDTAQTVFSSDRFDFESSGEEELIPSASTVFNKDHKKFMFFLNHLDVIARNFKILKPFNDREFKDDPEGVYKSKYRNIFLPLCTIERQLEPLYSQAKEFLDDGGKKVVEALKARLSVMFN